MSKESQAGPKRIGLLVGREWSWPPAFIEEVNRRDAGVVAEFVTLGGPTLDDVIPWAVVVDRISHEVPFYRTWLKPAAPRGVQVMGVYVGLVDTDMAAFAGDSPKSSPADVVRQVLDGVESGADEVLADEMTRQVRAQLGTLIHHR